MRAQSSSDKGHDDDSNQDAILCKEVSAGSKVAASVCLGIKRLPGAVVLHTAAKSGAWGAKIVAAAAGGLSKYHRGKSPNEAASLALMDLGLSILFPVYRVCAVSGVLLEYGGRATGCETAEYTGIAMQNLLDEFKGCIVSFPPSAFTWPSCMPIDPIDEKFQRLADYSFTRIRNDASKKSLDHAFTDCINGIAQEYAWEQGVTDRFNILSAAKLSEHLVYDDKTKTIIFTDVTQSAVFPEMPILTTEENNAVQEKILRIYDESMGQFESKIPALLRDNLLAAKDALPDDLVLTEESVSQLMTKNMRKLRSQYTGGPSQYYSGLRDAACKCNASHAFFAFLLLNFCKDLRACARTSISFVEKNALTG